MGPVEEGIGEVGDSETRFTVKIKNKNPINLSILARSLSALADGLYEFSEANIDASNTNFYVKRIYQGSLIFDLIAVADQANLYYENGKIVASFFKNLYEVTQYFLIGKGQAPTERDAEIVARVLEPIAAESNSSINFSVNAPTTININNFTVNSTEAKAIRSKVRHLASPPIPQEELRFDELMTLEQLKGSIETKTGDRGVIASIWPKPIKIVYVSEDVKSKILEMTENPFQQIYIVDVRVQRVDDKPYLYKILNVKSIIPRSDD